MKKLKKQEELYIMVGLGLAAKNFGEHVIDGYQGEIKHYVIAANNAISRLHRETIHLAEKVGGKDQWMREFTDRDHEAISSVLFLFIHMDEDRRKVAEEFMEQLAMGDITAEKKANSMSKILTYDYAPGILWFRVFGYGLLIKDIYRHPKLCSERFGLRKHLMIGKYLIRILKPQLF